MEFKIYETKKGNNIFRIEEDYPEVGAYLYVINKGKCIKDFLQNSVETCKCFALEEYGIPIEDWSLIDTSNNIL
jgi:hypothetical protein